MTVLGKIFMSSKVKLPAHGRIGEFISGSTRLSILGNPQQKRLELPCKM